jgi:hypothetical protein
MSTAPINNLELRAIEERDRLRRRTAELKAHAEIVRQNLDLTRNVRRHFGLAAILVAAVGLLSGYGAAGLFTRH